MQNTSFIHRTFLAHPDTVGETYVQHMGVSGRFSIVLFGLAIAALVHAILPCAFEKTVSRRILKMSKGMQARSDTADPHV